MEPLKELYLIKHHTRGAINGAIKGVVYYYVIKHHEHHDVIKHHTREAINVLVS